MSGIDPTVRQRFTLAMAQALADNEVRTPKQVEKLASETLDAIETTTPLSHSERLSLIVTLPDFVTDSPKSVRARMWARGVLDFAAMSVGVSSEQLHDNVAAGLAAIADKTDEPVNPDLLAPTTLAVLGGLPVVALTPELQEQLRGVSAKDLATASADLWQQTVSKLNERNTERALGKLALAVRQLSVGHRRTHGRSYGDPLGPADWGRDYGLHALLPDDPAWTDAELLLKINGLAASGVENSYDAKNIFGDEWRALSPRSTPYALFATGSDAVNHCFTLAEQAGRRRLGLPEDSPPPKMLVFSGAYGGGRGPSAEICDYGKRLDKPHMARWRIESPFSTNPNPTDPEEIARLAELEDAAIARIRERAADTVDPVGAIFIEPVPGFHGVFFYRPQFLARLRQVADELELPIIADEILSGGGRTGKMWSYEHFDGFEPDWFAFGKNMQACGVARTSRCRTSGAHNITTMRGDPITMLRAAAYMKRIRTGHLIENVAEVGAHILEQVRKIEETAGDTPTASGLGMLIGTSRSISKLRGTMASEGRLRLMPPFTLSKEQADEILEPAFEEARKRAEWREKYNRQQGGKS